MTAFFSFQSFRDNARQLLDEERAASPDLELNAMITDDSVAVNEPSDNEPVESDVSCSALDGNSLNDFVDNLSQLTGTPAVDGDALSPDHSWSPSLETSSFVADTVSSVDETSESGKTTQMVNDLRAFGILLCSNLLKQLPPSVEPMVQQALRNLTSSPGQLDSEAFSEVEAKASK